MFLETYLVNQRWQEMIFLLYIRDTCVVLDVTNKVSIYSCFHSYRTLFSVLVFNNQTFCCIDRHNNGYSKSNIIVETVLMIYGTYLIFSSKCINVIIKPVQQCKRQKKSIGQNISSYHCLRYQHRWHPHDYTLQNMLCICYPSYAVIGHGTHLANAIQLYWSTSNQI